MVDMKKLTCVMLMLCTFALLMTSFAFAESHEHVYGEWHTQTEATCGKAGLKVRMCTVDGCGEVDKQEIQPTGNHSYGEWTTTTEATCGKDGQKMRMCGSCGNVEKDTILATGEHDYGEWSATTEATCTAKGEKMRICDTCGNVEKDEIPTLEHTYETKTIAPTKSSKGYTLHTCNVCGYSFKDNWKAKISTSSGTKKSSTKPTTTAAPEKNYGSIVTDVNEVALEYEFTADNNVLEIVAPAEADGSYAIRELHLSIELLAQLKEEKITVVRFVNGDVAVEFSIDVFDAESIQLIAVDLDNDVIGYVVAIDPNAEIAEMIHETIATVDGTFTDITEFVIRMELSVNGTLIEAEK